VQCQLAYVDGGLQPGAALVVVRLAIVTFQSSSTAPAQCGWLVFGSAPRPPCGGGIQPPWYNGRAGIIPFRYSPDLLEVKGTSHVG